MSVEALWVINRQPGLFAHTHTHTAANKPQKLFFLPEKCRVKAGQRKNERGHNGEGKEEQQKEMEGGKGSEEGKPWCKEF